MLAIALQCLLVQTHFHAAAIRPASLFSADAGIAAGAAEAPSPDPRQHRHGGAGLCYICQSAVAGAAILSSTPSLNLVEVGRVVARVFAGAVEPHDRSPSHGWRSRAPPIQH